MPSAELVRLPPRLAFERAARTLIAAKRSPNTRRAYTADLERWLAYCYPQEIDPAHPGLEATVEFRDHLLRCVSPVTVRRTLSALSSLYRVLFQQRVTGGNPFHAAVLAWPPAVTIGKTVAVETEVALAMIAQAEADTTWRGKRDTAILRLLYDTGLRRASIAALVRDGYRKTKRDTILRAVVKGQKEVELRLPEETAQAIDNWLAVAPPSPFLFPGRSGLMMDHNTINKIVVTRSENISKDVHPHRFRAAFVTAGYEAQLPEHEIQASVHHSDAKTTRRYDNRSSSRGMGIAEAIAKFRKAPKEEQ